LIGVDHVHAHLYSVVLETNLQPDMPAVGLVCSGGHTALYEVKDWLNVRLIGSTIDDAVGEAYDKVAAILGLGYPGGPILDRLAERGNPSALSFPRTLLKRESLDFSFSGLKTSVAQHVRARGGVPQGQELSDLCASFQEAVCDALTLRAVRAARASSTSTRIPRPAW